MLFSCHVGYIAAYLVLLVGSIKNLVLYDDGYSLSLCRKNDEPVNETVFIILVISWIEANDNIRRVLIVNRLAAPFGESVQETIQ